MGIRTASAGDLEAIFTIAERNSLKVAAENMLSGRKLKKYMEDGLFLRLFTFPFTFRLDPSAQPV